MSGMTYLWIEDRKDKAGYLFWKEFMRELYPDVVVESKKNNSELFKAVKALSDAENRYIIVYDNSFDNMQVYKEHKALKKYTDEKHNVQMMDIICFEYILLEFDKLIDWIYAQDDEFLIKRADAVKARNMLVETFKSEAQNYRTLQDVIKYDANLNEHNIEQLSSKLLFDLTRNTGFEVSKGSIGDCWLKSCCDWMDREDNDVCGLDDNRLSVAEKMKCIYVGTSLRMKLSDVGLEMLSC